MALGRMWLIKGRKWIQVAGPRSNRGRPRGSTKKKTVVKKLVIPSKSLFKKPSTLAPARSYGGFPLSKSVTLRYVTIYALTGQDNGLVASKSIRANGIYDPEVPIGGEQPMGRDQWAGLYNHYVVKSSNIKVQFMTPNLTTDAPRPITVGILLDDDATLEATLTKTVMERGNCNCITMPMYYDQKVTLTKTYDCTKWFDIVDVQDNVARVGAPVGADPSEQAHFVIFAGSLDTTWAVQGTMYAIVTVDYNIEWSEPKDMSAS